MEKTSTDNDGLQRLKKAAQLAQLCARLKRCHRLSPAQQSSCLKEKQVDAPPL